MSSDSSDPMPWGATCSLGVDPSAFPQWRRDPIVGRWVIVAPERAARPAPKPSAAPGLVGAGDDCPFCVGHEDRTPDEIAAWRDPGLCGPGNWRVRVVPNRYPAVRSGGEVEGRHHGLHEQCTGVGIHEVIVDCPHHRVSMADEPIEQFRALFHIYRDRLAALSHDTRLQYGVLFKNVGVAGGASLQHPHSQLVGVPMVPFSITEELHGSRRYWHAHGRCVWCALIEQEEWQGERIICATPHIIAFAPFASRVPFEICILPRRHGSHFERLGSVELDELASVFKTVLMRLERATEGVGYNYLLHTAPFHGHDGHDFHWHWEIVPRLTTMAGFEWGTGQTINPLPPEQAAAILRRG